MIAYFLLHSAPNQIFEPLGHLIPYEDILFQSHFLYYISIGVFFFSFLFLQPLSILPSNLNDQTKKNQYFERVLYMVGMIILIQLMFQQDKMGEELVSMEKYHFVQEDKIQRNTHHIFQKEKELIQLYESKFIELKTEIDSLNYQLIRSQERIESLEKKVAAVESAHTAHREPVATAEHVHEELQEKIASLTSYVQSNVEQTNFLLNDRIPSFEKAFAGFQERIDNIPVQASSAPAADSPALTGDVLIWYKEEIPAGYRICDGSAGPDLRDRFLVGGGLDYSLGDSGGNNKIHLHAKHFPALTLDATQSEEVPVDGRLVKAEGVHVAEGREVGEVEGIDIRPPYHAVYFICRETR
jgi:hypothetical protein